MGQELRPRGVRSLQWMPRSSPVLTLPCAFASAIIPTHHVTTHVIAVPMSSFECLYPAHMLQCSTAVRLARLTRQIRPLLRSECWFLEAGAEALRLARQDATFRRVIRW